MTRTAARWLLVLLTSALTLSIVLLGYEVLLRRATARVVARQEADVQGSSGLLDPNQIVETLPDGRRRFVPGVRAVVRDHPYAHRDIAIEINSFGFRSPEIPQRKPAGTLRVLALGDSVTMGEGIDERETYARRLEAHLRARRPAQPIDVINAGIGDTGTREQVDVFRERGLALDPDVVLVGFYLNDSRPPWGFAGELGTRGWLRRHSAIADVVYQRMAARRWLRDQGGDRFEWIRVRDAVDWAHDPRAFQQLVGAARYDWGAAWDPGSWTALRPMFDELKALAGHRKIVFAVFPVSYQVDSKGDEGAPQSTARRLAADLGFLYFDVLPLLRAQDGRTALFYDHCHLTPAGNDLVGSALAAFLTQQGIVDVEATR